MLCVVSRSVSPFDCEELAVLKLTTSADRRCAAISKETRVRVEGSKKMGYKSRFLPQERLGMNGWELTV